jgi:hypothetical protein
MGWKGGDRVLSMVLALGTRLNLRTPNIEIQRAGKVIDSIFFTGSTLKCRNALAFGLSSPIRILDILVPDILVPLGILELLVPLFILDILVLSYILYFRWAGTRGIGPDPETKGYKSLDEIEWISYS